MPGNDDAIRAIRLFAGTIADAAQEGRALYEANARSLEDQRAKQQAARDARSRQNQQATAAAAAPAVTEATPAAAEAPAAPAVEPAQS